MVRYVHDQRLGEDLVVEAQTVRLSEIESERISWLWKHRIPRGMVTLVDGDPGVGKSTLMLDLAARVSTGTQRFTGVTTRRPAKQIPADVLLMTAEDHLAAVARPRLEAAGADLSRIHAIVAMPCSKCPPASMAPTLDEANIHALEGSIIAHKARLVIIDPLMAFMPSDVDTYRDQDVRRVLRHLSEVAEQTEAAIVIVRHLRKGAGTALHRGSGSIGIVGAARSALLVANDPLDRSLRIVAVAKSNLAAHAPSLRWKLVDCDQVARVEWVGLAEEISADQLAVAPDPTMHVRDESLELATRALQEVLGHGPLATREVLRSVREMTGASSRTIERARAALGVVAARERGTDGRTTGWVLQLPETTPPSGE